ncbi:hypothetical protein BRC86_06825 [Halobacteriales archaeon QS_3_64_16]|nr:MAG: hypothetical protein BRC86_06825 [Halobacteriales archaeon QS_3_64_16]
MSPEREQDATTATERSDDWMQPGDRRLLDSLRRDGPESRPLLAARIGMHLKYARKRCEALEARELVRSRDGRRYELTERGECYLEELDSEPK